MLPGPPKALERFVGLLLPPACREEVLGDLCEKYETPRQYVATAARVVPSIILSRIRRTTDLQLLVIEASVLYGSYLASAWYRHHALLSKPDLQRLAIPVICCDHIGLFLKTTTVLLGPAQGTGSYVNFCWHMFFSLLWRQLLPPSLYLTILV